MASVDVLRAGHKDAASPHYNYSLASPVDNPIKPSLSTSTTSRSNSGLDDGSRAGAGTPSLPKSNKPIGSRSQLRSLDTSMSSYTSTTTLSPSSRSAPGHAKLHKRAGSGSSLPGPPSPFQGAYTHHPTPFATSEEPFPDLSATTPVASTPRIKPYLRKKSNADEEQGRLDLSKSTWENDRLAGLGIQDFGVRSASDVTFAHASRRATHARTTSVGSQVSTGSGSFRPTQPFVHPMRQTPRPYTPPTGSSNASFVDETEANESDDVVDDEFNFGSGFRIRRSISITSVPQIAPTPLSQTHTADDLGVVPKLTSGSQTNLSIKSVRSTKSSKSRLGRTRRDTDRSVEGATSLSSRTSLDKAFSFVSRRSDPDPQTRDERIRAARRKFEEKEANKDRKAEKEALKRHETEETKSVKKQERQGQKSETDGRTRGAKQHSDKGGAPSGKKGKRDDEEHNNQFHSRSYEKGRPADQSSLPRRGLGADTSEMLAPTGKRNGHSPQSGWDRFSAWLQPRMLGCGGKR